MRDIQSCRVEGSEAQAFNVGHGVLQDEGIPRLVVTLSEFLDTGHSNLGLLEIIAHPVHLSP